MATRSYAQGTKVDTNRSKVEIERTLERFGATGFMFGRDDDERVFIVGFRRNGRGYRFVLPMVDREQFRYNKPRSSWQKRGAERADTTIDKLVDQETKRRWRSLANLVKATLDATDTGIIDFDTAMMPHLVLPDGRTMGQAIGPQVDAALEGRDPNISLALPPGATEVDKK